MTKEREKDEENSRVVSEKNKNFDTKKRIPGDAAQDIICFS